MTFVLNPWKSEYTEIITPSVILLSFLLTTMGKISLYVSILY